MKKVTILGVLFLATWVAVPSISEAKETNNETSDAHVIFEENSTEVTPPILPPDPIDPDNGGTNNIGSLTIDYVSNIQFGLQKISGGTEKYTAKNAQPYIQITDKRGTGAGWLLTASISEFSGDNKGEKAILKGATLSLINGSIQPAAGNLSIAPNINKVIFDNSEEKYVMNAEKMQGMGTFVDVFKGEDVSLEVPGGVAISKVDYHASIIWILGDTPLG